MRRDIEENGQKGDSPGLFCRAVAAAAVKSCCIAT